MKQSCEEDVLSEESGAEGHGEEELFDAGRLVEFEELEETKAEPQDCADEYREGEDEQAIFRLKGTVPK